MIFMSPRRQLVVAVLQVVMSGTHSSRIRAGPRWTHLCEGEQKILRIQWGGCDMKDRNIKKNFWGCRTWEGLLNLRNMGYMMYTASSEMLQKMSGNSCSCFEVSRFFSIRHRLSLLPKYSLYESPQLPVCGGEPKLTSMKTFTKHWPHVKSFDVNFSPLLLQNCIMVFFKSWHFRVIY